MAHESHDLLTLGGIIGCSLCGSFAARDIGRSFLVKQCKRALTGDGRRALDKFAAGKLPRSNIKQWPDSGFDADRNGGDIRPFRMQPQ